MVLRPAQHAGQFQPLDTGRSLRGSDLGLLAGLGIVGFLGQLPEGERVADAALLALELLKGCFQLAPLLA
jgi:hypothetical protein